MLESEILQNARDFIADKSHWVCGYYGKDAEGNGTGTSGIMRAVCVCAEGATVRAGWDERDRSIPSKALRILDAASFELFGRSTVSVNDHDALDGSISGEDERHAAILRAYDHAIALAKSEEANATSANG